MKKYAYGEEGLVKIIKNPKNIYSYATDAV